MGRAVSARTHKTRPGPAGNSSTRASATKLWGTKSTGHPASVNCRAVWGPTAAKRVWVGKPVRALARRWAPLGEVAMIQSYWAAWANAVFSAAPPSAGSLILLSGKATTVAPQATSCWINSGAWSAARVTTRVRPASGVFMIGPAGRRRLGRRVGTGPARRPGLGRRCCVRCLAARWCRQKTTLLR